MEKVKGYGRELAEERTKIMDLMVAEHVRSIECQLEVNDQLYSMHCLKKLEERYKQISQQLQELKKCNDVLMDSGIRTSEPHAIKDFCSELESLIIRHCDKLCGETFSRPDNDVNELRKSVEFTDEEEYGKYLDLHECYQLYLKLERIEEVDYITFVATFDHLFDIPRERKNARYHGYLKVLCSYLQGYLARVQPFRNVDHEMDEAKKTFEAQWEDGTFPGWSKGALDVKWDSGTNRERIALSSWSEFKSCIAELGVGKYETVGVTTRGVSNTVDDVRRRHTPLDLSEFGGNRGAHEIVDDKEIASLEALVNCLSSLVSIQRVATLERIKNIRDVTIGEYINTECKINVCGNTKN